MAERNQVVPISITTSSDSPQDAQSPLGREPSIYNQFVGIEIFVFIKGQLCAQSVQGFNMMILGISASGREVERDGKGTLLKGVTEEFVKYILENSGVPNEYISLNGKNILGCQGCLKCAGDNVCRLEDDWAEIRDQMISAEALVFGAPVYYGTINALGHAFLERLFSLRHRERFTLAGKLNVIVTAGTSEPNPAEDYIQRAFRSNYMAEPIGRLRVRGISQCYTCGYWKDCAAGSVVARHGFLEEIKGYHVTRIPAVAYKNAEVIAKRLGTIINTKRKSQEKT